MCELIHCPASDFNFLISALAQITINITLPMLQLLNLVKSINCGSVQGDTLPLFVGGSTETRQVYISFSKLHKVVRISNIAYFSGNLGWANHFMLESLKLFRSVGDRKAIGIVSNNIGNVFYSAYYEKKRNVGLVDIGAATWDVTAALEHYDKAVEIGKQELEEAATPDVKALFAQQLADRYFNRGLFLLLTQNEKNAPKDARLKAHKDISRARALDCDVNDYWVEHKMLLQKFGSYLLSSDSAYIWSTP